LVTPRLKFQHMYLKKQVHLYFYYQCLQIIYQRELQLFVNFPWVYYVFLLAHYAQKQVFLKYHVFYHHFQISQFENFEFFFDLFCQTKDNLQSTKIVKKGHVVKTNLKCRNEDKPHIFSWSSSPYLPSKEYLVNSRVNHGIISVSKPFTKESFNYL
jgi:hypothetical protein